MSGKFSGFSQDDINKIKTKNKENPPKIASMRQSTTNNKSNPPTKPNLTGGSNNNLTKRSQPPPSVPSLPLTETTATDQNISTSMLTSADSSLQEAIHFKPLPQKVYGSSESIDAADSNGNDPITKRSDISSPIAFKGMSLKDYEAQRRMIEEQNKQRKDLLCKAIEQHSERTAAEARKLKDIKIELNKLESELAADVAILRKQIDSASLLYMTAQKNYEQIESSFLRAKLELHHAREKKDLLAEHLSIIISNNEDRKARKLSDLMAKVGLTLDGEANNE